MSKIMIQCPNTSAEVWTGIETDPKTFKYLSNAQSQMTCAACDETHVWSRRQAWLAGFEKTLPPKRRSSTTEGA